MTLCPALSALMMRPGNVSADAMGYAERFHYAFDKSFNAITNQYRQGVMFLFKNRWLVIILFLLSVGALWWFVSTSKNGLVPQEDMGTISLNVQVAPGSNLAETDEVMDKIENAIRDIPEINIYSRVTGKNARHEQSASAGSFNIRLKDWSERKNSGQDINTVIKEIIKELPE